MQKPEKKEEKKISEGAIGIFVLVKLYLEHAGYEKERMKKVIIARAKEHKDDVKEVWENPAKYGKEMPTAFLEDPFGKEFDAQVRSGNPFPDTVEVQPPKAGTAKVQHPKDELDFAAISRRIEASGLEWLRMQEDERREQILYGWKSLTLSAAERLLRDFRVDLNQRGYIPAHEWKVYTQIKHLKKEMEKETAAGGQETKSEGAAKVDSAALKIFALARIYCECPDDRKELENAIVELAQRYPGDVRIAWTHAGRWKTGVSPKFFTTEFGKAFDAAMRGADQLTKCGEAGFFATASKKIGEGGVGWFEQQSKGYKRAILSCWAELSAGAVGSFLSEFEKAAAQGALPVYFYRAYSEMRLRRKKWEVPRPVETKEPEPKGMEVMTEKKNEEAAGKKETEPLIAMPIDRERLFLEMVAAGKKLEEIESRLQMNKVELGKFALDLMMNGKLRPAEVTENVKVGRSQRPVAGKNLNEKTLKEAHEALEKPYRKPTINELIDETGWKRKKVLAVKCALGLETCHPRIADARDRIVEAIGKNGGKVPNKVVLRKLTGLSRFHIDEQLPHLMKAGIFPEAKAMKPEWKTTAVTDNPYKLAARLMVSQLAPNESRYLLLKHLAEGGKNRYEIAKKTGVSSGSLHYELKNLKDTGLVLQDGEGYAVTKRGRKVLKATEAIFFWGHPPSRLDKKKEWGLTKIFGNAAHSGNCAALLDLADMQESVPGRGWVTHGQSEEAELYLHDSASFYKLAGMGIVAEEDIGKSGRFAYGFSEDFAKLKRIPFGEIARKCPFKRHYSSEDRQTADKLLQKHDIPLSVRETIDNPSKLQVGWCIASGIFAHNAIARKTGMRRTDVTMNTGMLEDAGHVRKRLPGIRINVEEKHARMLLEYLRALEGIVAGELKGRRLEVKVPEKGGRDKFVSLPLPPPVEASGRKAYGYWTGPGGKRKFLRELGETIDEEGTSSYETIGKARPDVRGAFERHRREWGIKNWKDAVVKTGRTHTVKWKLTKKECLKELKAESLKAKSTASCAMPKWVLRYFFNHKREWGFKGWKDAVNACGMKHTVREVTKKDWVAAMRKNYRETGLTSSTSVPSKLVGQFKAHWKEWGLPEKWKEAVPRIGLPYVAGYAVLTKEEFFEGLGEFSRKYGTNSQRAVAKKKRWRWLLSGFAYHKEEWGLKSWKGALDEAGIERVLKGGKYDEEKFLKELKAACKKHKTTSSTMIKTKTNLWGIFTQHKEKWGYKGIDDALEKIGLQAVGRGKPRTRAREKAVGRKEALGRKPKKPPVGERGSELGGEPEKPPVKKLEETVDGKPKKPPLKEMGGAVGEGPKKPPVGEQGEEIGDEPNKPPVNELGREIGGEPAQPRTFLIERVRREAKDDVDFFIRLAKQANAMQLSKMEMEDAVALVAGMDEKTKRKLMQEAPDAYSRLILLAPGVKKPAPEPPPPPPPKPIPVEIPVALTRKVSAKTQEKVDEFKALAVRFGEIERERTALIQTQKTDQDTNDALVLLEVERERAIKQIKNMDADTNDALARQAVRVHMQLIMYAENWEGKKKERSETARKEAREMLRAGGQEKKTLFRYMGTLEESGFTFAGNNLRFIEKEQPEDAKLIAQALRVFKLDYTNLVEEFRNWKRHNA